MIQSDENGHNNKNFDCKIKRQKTINEEIGCKIIRIVPDKEDFSFLELFSHMIQSTKKALINKISTRLSGYEFKSDNIIKSKAIKIFIKKMLPD